MAEVISMTDPFYLTPFWRQLRAARLELDDHLCVVPGCGQPATHVDHIISRKAGGADSLANLRSLCREHDDQVKQRPGGKRAHGGRLFVRGSHADGSPKDPGHPWYKA